MVDIELERKHGCGREEKRREEKRKRRKERERWDLDLSDNPILRFRFRWLLLQRVWCP